MGAAITNNDSIEEKLRFLQNGNYLENKYFLEKYAKDMT